jgi:DNA-binding transcriptional regulator of glucitol operon
MFNQHWRGEQKLQSNVITSGLQREVSARTFPSFSNLGFLRAWKKSSGLEVIVIALLAEQTSVGL